MSHTSTIQPTPSTYLHDGIQPVCLGYGIDASADGILSTLIFSGMIGSLIWLTFALLRPRYRQVYALREWFVRQELRPKSLDSSFWTFLFPHVPLIPPILSDVSDAGRSPVIDAKVFPSDEELSQRVMWTCFLIVSVWTLVGLAGALPLFLVTTPCLADLPSQARWTGVYSTMQDLSLLRLLQLLDSGDVSPKGTSEREVVNGTDRVSDARHRLIILTVFAIVLIVLPALSLLLKEFDTLVNHRQRWIDVHCQGKEMGWLSARKAPGFLGWGEQRMKDFILKIALSSSLERVGRNGVQNEHQAERARRRREELLAYSEEAKSDVDIQDLFSIGDTQNLALLIDERDEILENLEIAETRYIGSFRLSTPDPSVADFQLPVRADPPEVVSRPTISRPRPLTSSSRYRRRHRAINPAYASSSLAPSSFVGPAQYYKLRGSAKNVGSRSPEPTLSDSIHSRVVGSRFQEVNPDSLSQEHLPLGSHIRLDKTIDTRRSLSSASTQDMSRRGPSHDGMPSPEMEDYGFPYPTSPAIEETYEEGMDDEWVDVRQENSSDPTVRSDEVPALSSPPANYFDFAAMRRRPKIAATPPGERRETFPLRNRENTQAESAEVPPHLRLQPRQPFVRPTSGLDLDDLGAVYADISRWRSKLKQLNAEIADAQRECYTDIAEGTRIKGWLMIGRGLRFIPGMELIEGRAKEDIRWDILQNERSRWDSAVMWTVIVLAIVALAAGLTAVVGLSLGMAPDVSHYLTFLQPLSRHNGLPTGLATYLASAVAACLFVFMALAIVDLVVSLRGCISLTACQALSLKISFFVLSAVVGIWIVLIGALLYSLEAFDAESGESRSLANGAIYTAVLLMAIVINLAVIYPGILLLQPFHLRSILAAEKEAVTPRQRFRAAYPRCYNPALATCACTIAFVFASTFSVIFPLIGPPVVLLFLLTIIAHRYLVGYVYARTHSQSGGLLQIWLLRRFSSVVSFQPVLLGLILLSRRLWVIGSVLAGVGVAVIIIVESYTSVRTALPGRKSLSAITQDSLRTFQNTAKPVTSRAIDEESTSLVSTGRGTRTRGSMASVLEMMSTTLAVVPPPSQVRGPVPLPTETLDDLTATDRAARTHPDAPPHLPPLPFSEHAEEMAGILYAPELIAPPPIIWLPNDTAGVARSEAFDLRKYHNLRVTLDVRGQDDVSLHRMSSVRQAP